MQHEIKTGFVFLHSCDGCSSHEPIIELSQKIISTVSEILEILKPGPSVPPSPSDYTGNYSIGAQGPVRNYIVKSRLFRPCTYWCDVN